jgi:hypothetical protein
VARVAVRKNQIFTFTFSHLLHPIPVHIFNRRNFMAPETATIDFNATLLTTGPDVIAAMEAFFGMTEELSSEEAFYTATKPVDDEDEEDEEEDEDELDEDDDELEDDDEEELDEEDDEDEYEDDDDDEEDDDEEEEDEDEEE